jgi:outer membrane protein assembly factor BamB
VRFAPPTICWGLLAWIASALPQTPAPAAPAGKNLPAPAFQAGWTVTLDARDPLVAAGSALVFLGSKSGALTAYAIEDGHPVWTKDIRTSLTPVVGADLLFVFNDSAGALVALDQATGAERWRTPVGELAVTPLHQSGWLFAAGKDGSMTALRSADGSQVWRQAVGVPAAARLALDGDRLFAALTDGRLISMAVNSDGRVEWTCPLDSPGGIPFAVGERVYVSSTKGTLYSIKQKNGRLDWRHARIGAAAVGHAVVDGSRLFIATLDSRVVALNRDGGAQLWWAPVDARPAEQLTITDGHLLAPLASGEIAIVPEKTGKAVAPLPAPKTAGVRLAAPVVFGGSAESPVLFRVTLGTDAVPLLESFTRQKK